MGGERVKIEGLGRGQNLYANLIAKDWTDSSLII